MSFVKLGNVGGPIRLVTAERPVRISTAAGGTHPTGMHSCIDNEPKPRPLRRLTLKFTQLLPLRGLPVEQWAALY